jgi:hypothetical protein
MYELLKLKVVLVRNLIFKFAGILYSEGSNLMFCRLEEFLVLLLVLLLWILKPGGATMHFQSFFKPQKQVLTKNYVLFFILLQ